LNLSLVEVCSAPIVAVRGRRTAGFGSSGPLSLSR